MRKYLTLIILLTHLIAKADYWTQKADFGGGTRECAVAFSINGLGYVGGGLDSLNNMYIEKSDFWQYDPAINVWTQKSNIGTTPRPYSIGFSIGNYGYVGLGNVSDFLKYDPANNTWSQITTFPGMNRISASVFVCNSKAYIGLGRDTQSNAHYYDFWEFDPSNNNWVQKSNFPGVARRAAITFSINNIGYIGNGYNNAPLFDSWKYDPVLNSWASIPPCPVLLYSDPGGFSIGNEGYFCLGTMVLDSNMWMYNSNLNSWTQKTLFPASIRGSFATFTIGSKAYIVGGTHNWFGFTYPLKDVWEYSPDSVTNTQEVNKSELKVSIYPNPFINQLNISSNEKVPLKVILYDINMRKLLQKGFTNVAILNTQQFEKGMYLYEVSSKNGLLKKGKIRKD